MHCFGSIVLLYFSSSFCCCCFCNCTIDTPQSIADLPSTATTAGHPRSTSMPGDTSMRDQTLDKDRRKFTSGLIRAIEDLELRRISRSPQQLADAAWQKLQYDFPLVETEELQALLEAFRSSFVGKAGWPCYLLTHKALENICQGARGAASYAPQLTEQEQQVQQILSDSLSSKVSGRSNSSNARSTQPQQQQQQQSQQQVYQQLAGVLLLQYAAKVASLPDQEAWQLLQGYCPDLEHEHNQEHFPEDAHSQQQQQIAGIGDQTGAVTAALAAAAGLFSSDPSAAAASAASGTSSSCVVYEDAEAAQQDGDSEEYEPLELGPIQPHQHHQPHRNMHQLHHHPQKHSSQHLQHPQNLQQPSWGVPMPGQSTSEPQGFSWPALQTKLLALADHVHYSLLSYEPLWSQHGAAQHLLTLLRLLGVHSHAQDLQQLLHAYVGLLVDRLASAPQDLPLLHQLWEALGLLSTSQGHHGSTLGSSQGLAGFSGHVGSKTQGSKPQFGLHPEAVLGLTVAASVWQQLPGATARKQLWQIMFDDLLPLLEVCAEQLAYSSSKAVAKRSSSSSSSKANNNTSSSSDPPSEQAPVGEHHDAPAAGAAGGVSAATQGAAFAHVLLLSHVVQLLVLGRPNHVDVGQVLTQAGVTRSLVALHMKWGCEVSAEPLRRALLLACCSSPQTAAWVLAVPTLVQQLQQQCFELGQPCESHGAMWQLLMHQNNTNNTSSNSRAKAVKPTAAKPAAETAHPGSSSNTEGRDEGLEQQLLSLLRLQASSSSSGNSSVQLLQRQVVVLQLMLDAQAAAGRGQRLWSDTVSAALRKLAAQLKEMEGPAVSEGTRAAAAANKGSMSSSDTDSDTEVEHVDCTAAGAADVECNGHPQQQQQEEKEKDQGSASGRRDRQQQQQVAADVAQLEHRRSAQLQPTALRLVKELLTQGGGKTD